jgi:hypothetical protein
MTLFFGYISKAKVKLIVLRILSKRNTYNISRYVSKSEAKPVVKSAKILVIP